MHALDVAHCVFALSLQGGAAARVNLGQAPFRFDLGAALAPAAGATHGRGGGGAADADELASVVSSAGALSLGGGAPGARPWRTSVGGESIRSSLSGHGAAAPEGGGDTAGLAGLRGVASGAAERLAAGLRQLARNWSARSYGSEVDEDVRAALQRFSSDLGRRESASTSGLQGVLAWLGIGGSVHE